MKKTIAFVACAAMMILPAVAGAASDALANDALLADHQTAAMVLAGLMIMATIVRRRSHK
jgi:hypothetical protein